MDNTTEPPGSNSDSSLGLQALEMDLTPNKPEQYDDLVKHIELLRKQGDPDKLRNVREAMSKVFPLAPQMWCQWADDEVSLLFPSSGHEAPVSEIEKLYERGVSDYMSVSLWCDYLSFIQKYDSSVRECSKTGISKARDLFERALVACGLHVAEGSKIWEAYRGYEVAILNKMNETDSKPWEEQIQRIRKIFHRQLTIPLVDLKSTFMTYKTWESEHGNLLNATNSTTDGIPSDVASAYEKASIMMARRDDFEKQIAERDVSDKQCLKSFMLYLKAEQSFGHPARVINLYERAITVFPVSSDLWMEYTYYLHENLKTDKTVRDCFHRATRNCPWVGALWVRFMLKLERCRGSEKELSDVFQRSLQCKFDTIDQYVEICLTRIDGLRRRFEFAGELDDGSIISSIRGAFELACGFLQQSLENTQRLQQIHSYWARLEVSIGNDITAARHVCESLLKKSGRMSEAWQAYISMETEMGNIKEARSLYKRCYTNKFFGTGSEDICYSWVRFEREFGSLEDFEHASEKATHRLQDLESVRLQQESKVIASLTAPKKGEKRKAAWDALRNEESTAKRQKDAPKKGETNKKRKGSAGHKTSTEKRW